MRRFVYFLFILLFIFPRTVLAIENRITPGKFRVEPPTHLCAGFEWEMVGDANRNARVEVKFREKGTKKWHAALPLMRQNGKRIWYDRMELDFTAPNLFAGSIFNLTLATTYECHFNLTDPDGVDGLAEQTVFVQARNVPKMAIDGRVRHVYPENFKEKKEAHGIPVDYDRLVNVPKPNPDRPGEVYRGNEFDFQLKPGRRPVDAGCCLPNVNDDFRGQTPDLGALEIDRPLPVFGLRTEIRKKLLVY